MCKCFSVTGTHVKKKILMGRFLIQRRDTYHCGVSIRDGYKRRTVKSDYLMGKWYIPNRGTM